MAASPQREQRAARWLLGAATAACLAVVAAPLLLRAAHPGAASLIYLCFAAVCHQLPGRSFHWLGYPLALCARCTGIFLGVWLATLAALVARVPRASRAGAVVAAALMAADVFTEFAALRPPLAGLRFATGFLVGVVAGPWLALSARQLAAEWKRALARGWRAQRVPA